MLSAVAAETLKLRRHRATWLLVWIFPIGALLVAGIFVLVQLARSDAAGTNVPDLQVWLSNTASFWALPSNGLIRIIVCAYLAVVFAGEYGWNTWKLIVPHRARSSLIASKYLVSLGLLIAAFTAAALIWSALTYLDERIVGEPLPEGITVGGLIWAQVSGFLGALPALLFTVALASFAAILTRSTIAAVVICFVIVTLEGLLVSFGPMLNLRFPGVDTLYQILPGYHLVNLRSWVLEGAAQVVPFPPAGEVAYGWAASLAIVALWTIGLMALTFWKFRRQDIN